MPAGPNFLQDIDIPQLGSNFSTQFQAFCEAVKNNFERLISVQYTKGNDGNSVEAKNIHIDANLDAQDDLSVLGYGLVSTMFGDGMFDSDATTPHDGLAGTYTGPQTKTWILDRLENPNEDPSITAKAPTFTFPYEDDQGGRHAIPCILDTDNIGFDLNIVIDEHNGKAYLAVPYVFIDGRITDLNRYIRAHANIDDIYKNFYDFSTVLYGVGTYDHNNSTHIEQSPETWDWKIWRNDMVPKLYFDENVNEFCWQVNGQQTGVTAQGIKGDDGYTPQIQVAMGTRTNDIITIDSLQIIDANGGVSYDAREGNLPDPVTINTNNVDITTLIWKRDPNGNPNKDIVIRNIDFMLVFYTYQEQGRTKNFAFLGRPYISSTGRVTMGVVQNNTDNIFDILKDQHFRDYLNSIVYGGTHDYADLRGIYIPGSATITDIDAIDKVHMIYGEGNDGGGYTKLHSAPVSMDSTHSSEPASNDPAGSSGNHIGDWQIDYNLDILGSAEIHGDLSVQGSIETQGNFAVQGNTYMQGNLRVEGDTYIQGNMTIQGQMVATGAPFRPIRDTHLAMVSKFRGTRCELMRTPTSAQGIVFNTKLTTTLDLKIGKVSFIGGVQGAAKNDAYMDANINTALHKVLSMYGSGSQRAQGMWDSGDNTCQQNITEQAKLFTTDKKLHNAPKLYDVIEYSIPITLAYPTYTYVRQFTTENTHNKYYVTYDVQSGGPYSDSDLHVTNRRVWQNLAVGTNDMFGTPSYRFQEYSEGGKDAYRPKISVSGGSLLSFGECQGAVMALKEKFIKFGDSDFHTVSGTLDYADGIVIEYYIDFFIRIFEHPASAQENTRSECDVNTTITILPVGYISTVINGTTYRAPIYGDLAVENLLPQTVTGSLFNEVILRTTLPQSLPILNS